MPFVHLSDSNFTGKYRGKHCLLVMRKYIRFLGCKPAYGAK